MVPVTRRRFLQSAAAGALAIAGSSRAQDTYDTHAKGIRILPGSWRPHYAWEHIAWVSPSWPSQDYIWLDFPEAIFTNQGLLFLSHVNPPFPTVHENLPAVPWREVEGGITFDRTLPSGIAFGGTVRKASERVISLELRLTNGSPEPLTEITLQTCAYLRAIREFADFTQENKFVHAPERDWITMKEATELSGPEQPYRVGWRRSGKPVADVPVAVAVSNKAERLMAMTWGESTLSMVNNSNHPCIHADPVFPDLEPGASAVIAGAIVFHEGPLESFDAQGVRTGRAD